MSDADRTPGRSDTHTDDLRTRIASAIYSKVAAWDDFPFDDLTDTFKAIFLEQADAVIRELETTHVLVERWQGN